MKLKLSTPINQQILILAVGPPITINLSLVNEFLSFWDYNQLHPIIIVKKTEPNISKRSPSLDLSYIRFVENRVFVMTDVDGQEKKSF
ncbi:unnamed protein product [Lactuca virosa]|uniref:Uncharacterized protein n=1 Tax=Lactuca virosa TaxID=75947 RepID=A0AAU9NEG8_9ASTR|nr:unnamed protein product [Lactuca virosa]